MRRNGSKRRNESKRKRALTLFICWVLCAANVIPTGLPVWASETLLQDESAVEGDPRSNSGLQTSYEEEAADGSGNTDDGASTQDPADFGEDGSSNENADTGEDGSPNENAGTGEDGSSNENADTGEDGSSNENAGTDEDDIQEETPTPPEENAGDETAPQPENTDDSKDTEDEEGDVPDQLEEDIETEAPEKNPDGDEYNAEINGKDSEALNSLSLATAIPAEVIASGSYTGNGSDTVWYIDKSGKLVVEGTGEFCGDAYDQRYAPWYDDRDEIKTAEIKVTGMTDASYMFAECGFLAEVDLSAFDTSDVVDMEGMFYRCGKLKSLDLSKFNTSKVTNMAFMFADCGVKSLDLSGFVTSNVTDMQYMFDRCYELESLNISRFNTSRVERMNNMFTFCSALESIDVSSFDTSRVLDMSEMFLGISVDLDLRGFDTSNVRSMWCMFAKNYYRTHLDLSSFDTSNVTDIDGMFNSSFSLEVLDLSSFDLGNVSEDMSSFLPNWKDGKLKTIYTPKNLKKKVPLKYVHDGNSTTETWYMADGTAVHELPQNLDHSIVLTKTKPAAAGASSILVSKRKTAYQCGEPIDVNDITVNYCNAQGAIWKLTTGFTTNASDIDMSTPGIKILVVTYTEPETGKALTAEIELTVTIFINGDSVTVTLPTETAYVYNGYPHNPVPVVTTKDSNSVTLEEGTDYRLSYYNNINAGTQAKVRVEGIGNYSGNVSAPFVIGQAKLTIKVQDTVIAVNDEVPKTFAYDADGFFGEEEVTGLLFSFADEDGSAVAAIDTSKPGIYQIIPKDAQVGTNYAVAEGGYQPGILTVAEERVAYTVTFDMMGHGTEIKPCRSVRSGSLIMEPTQPVAEGYRFTGWYKDHACTKAWNFEADTVQENTTLYARWTVQTAEGGIQIQEIKDQNYTGSAIKPALTVYAADGETLLKSGKDYTVKYFNNSDADQVAAEGGTCSDPEKAPGSFNKALPYIVISGKGNHTGTIYKNFHIRPVSISDARGNAAAGFTLKYSDQLVYNAKKDQNPFSSLKYKKAMKAGTDYTVTLRAVDAYDTKNKKVGNWSVSGSQENKWIPAIAKEYQGAFQLIIAGKGNYAGEIRQTVYVKSKAYLLKNAAIALGKNQKNKPYNNGMAVTLVPGYYDSYDRKYYKNEGSIDWDNPEANGDNLFTVKINNNCLWYGEDYTVTYANNIAVGTATMTVTGIGDYAGSKSITFKITGEAFKANTIDVQELKTSMPYTGRAVTQNKVTLATKVTGKNPVSKQLDYGRHYTISYKNNIKKGTATMTFTARPESGYSGSFKRTFKIGAVLLADDKSVKVEAASAENGQDSLTSAIKDEKGNPTYGLNGTVLYTREGAKPSRRILLSLLDEAGNKTGVVLKEGIDYTVSYSNNTVLASAGLANKIPTMTFKGKGNYTGSLKVTFTISEAAMEQGAANLAVSAAPVAFDDRKKDDYEYMPKITVKDGKETLGGNKDYEVKYENCGQTAVKGYLEKLEALGSPANAADNGGVAWEEIQRTAPRAVIRAVAGKGYKTDSGNEITVYLNVYKTKLTDSNLYVVVSGTETQTTYNGQQVRPDVTVYCGNANAVKAAKSDKVTDETKLTGGSYGLRKLTEKKEAAGDYILTYGANVAVGKNKGSVTVSGTGIYGGDVTVKFDILNRDIYQAP
ncbi:MAG: BspA family leucine-rich repeat surface protein [Lachnospiraceae bacterium]|nr:BspA family leucine-rich repeat surface protein [Lachnospiraceae bacterium]